MRHELLDELRLGDGRGMLGGDDDGVDTERDDLSGSIIAVLNSDLSLGIRSQPGEDARFTANNQSLDQSVGKNVSQRHELWSFISGITEHVALISSANFLWRLLSVAVDRVCDLGALFSDRNDDGAGLEVESLIRVVESDFLDGVTSNDLVVNHSHASNFTDDEDASSASGALAGDLRVGVDGQGSIENGIGDLVAKLIRVSRADTL